MLQLFIKNKIALVMCTVVAGLTVLMLGMGITFGKEARIFFPADGYVLGVDYNEESEASLIQNDFAAGTRVKHNASDQITILNEEQEISVHKDTFIHYNDHSLSSVGGMILTELSEFSDGLVDNYYLDGMRVLQNTAGKYVIQNNAQELSFETFLLKTGDHHYMLVDPHIELTTGVNGRVVTVDNGFLEICYLNDDTFSAYATDGMGAWQFLTSGSKAVLGNGSVLDLGKMTINSGTVDEDGKPLASISLLEIFVSEETGILITGDDEWIPPTFVIHSVDGEDGEAGEEGQAGEEGEDGNDGEDGEEGEDGKAGEAGSAGKKGQMGEHGRPGADGENTDDDEYTPPESPFVNITSWNQTAGSVEFELCAYNTSYIQEGTTESYILNVKTGATINIPGMELKKDDGETSQWKVDTLQPNTRYKLVISAMVLKEEDEEGANYGKSILVSREFYTDDSGFYLKKMQSDYITEDNVGEYGNETSLIGSACLGLRATLAGKQKLQEIQEVKISYIDKETREMVTLSDAENPFSDMAERDELMQTIDGESVYTLYNLKSDTEYTLEGTVVLEGGKTSTFRETYLTLKATPQVVNASFDTNENRFFISSATLKADPDNAISKFEHEIYSYIGGDLSGNCLKKKTTDNPRAYIYLSDSIKAGKDLNGANYEYGNRIYVTWFDNEKYVTKEVPRKDSWRAQYIAESDSSYIQFSTGSSGAVGTNRVKGTISIHTGAGRTIYVGDKDVHRILVQITSAGYTKVLYYSTLEEWKDDNGMSMKDRTSFSGIANLDFELTGLTEDNDYIVTVMAYFDANSSDSQTVGTTIIHTEKKTGSI